MFHKLKISHYFILLLSLAFSTITPKLAASDIIWYQKDINGEPIIHLYFFWSKKCPHCIEAQPYILELENNLPWLSLHSLELIDHPENVDTFVAMATQLGKQARSVPSFMFCGNMVSGYDSKNTTGHWLKSLLQSCYQSVTESRAVNNQPFSWQQQADSIQLPLIGQISFDQYSLPLLTLMIAAMDAFNPCAFFVLLFLLSMMVHSRSRRRMALIGGIFVFFSGLIYFVFMAAWLNLFIYLGELRIITYIAGSVALLIAVFNIKDFFFFKRGFSLAIAASNRPKLLDRMRSILGFDSLPAAILATVFLAVVANSYELLCTAGFPMVYTRILTLNVLTTAQYYLYLLLYNLIYILPLLVIVTIFTIKLGSRKLSEKEGMILKLLSGVMMLLLGSLLLLAPQLLNNLLIALLLVLSAILLTWVIVKISHFYSASQPKTGK